MAPQFTSGIRFYEPITIGELVRVEAQLIHTDNASMPIAIDLFSRGIRKQQFQKTTRCIIVFVTADENGNEKPVKKWQPRTERKEQLEAYALRLIELRQQIENEIAPYLDAGKAHKINLHTIGSTNAFYVEKTIDRAD